MKTVFVSHTSRNDPFVAALKHRLESRGYTVLEDSQFMPGDNLPDNVRNFIDRAPTVIAVGSTEATGSHWVKRELRYARQQGKRIIPLILPKSSTAQLREILELPEPTTTDDLQDWPAELIGIRVQEGAGGLDALLPGLLDALEGRGGGGQVDPGQARPPVPLADLVLRLRATRFELVKNAQGAEVRRPAATASLAYYPPGATDPAAESPEFPLSAPLGRIEAADLRFYLERYFLTPYGEFTKRARGIEARLPEWGQDLWETLPEPDPNASDPIKAWKAQAAQSDRPSPCRPRPRGSCAAGPRRRRRPRTAPSWKPPRNSSPCPGNSCTTATAFSSTTASACACATPCPVARLRPSCPRPRAMPRCACWPSAPGPRRTARPTSTTAFPSSRSPKRSMPSATSQSMRSSPRPPSPLFATSCAPPSLRAARSTSSTSTATASSTR